VKASLFVGGLGERLLSVFAKRKSALINNIDAFVRLEEEGFRLRSSLWIYHHRKGVQKPHVKGYTV